VLSQPPFEASQKATEIANSVDFSSSPFYYPREVVTTNEQIIEPHHLWNYSALAATATISALLIYKIIQERSFV
jgi:hypothetical protein